MFTGIIEEVGIVEKVSEIRGGKRISINAEKIIKGLADGDSVSVDGICQTVVYRSLYGFTIEAVGETLKKTTVGSFKTGRKVNLERAVKSDDRLGGHIVLGHVNDTGIINTIQRHGNHLFLELIVPFELKKYIVEEGSIAIDGISLTVASCNGRKVVLNIIPYTLHTTTLQYKNPRDKVNIEVDILAKYLEKIVMGNNKKNLNQETLKLWGYK